MVLSPLPLQDQHRDVILHIIISAVSDFLNGKVTGICSGICPSKNSELPFRNG